MVTHARPTRSGALIPAPLRKVLGLGGRVTDALDELGRSGSFYVRTVGWSYKVLVRYKREVLRLLSEVAFGTGALAVIGGTVVIVIFMTFFTGLEVGQQGYTSLN